MPIKFRCEHCRQFLGISHMKAGTLVDCPTCGRTIRVPDPEGKVQPMPDLQLNLKDSKLANALDELAMLGRATAAPELDAAVAVAEGDENAPNPPPAPPAHAAPKPMRVEPVVAAKPIPIEVHDTQQPVPVASMQELAALASFPTARDPAAEQPIVDIEMPLAQRTAGSAAWRRSATSWIVIAGLLGFIAGFVVGRRERPSIAIQKDPAGPGGKPLVVKNGGVKDPTVENSKTIAVRGSVTFQTEGGDQSPDRGARVLLLPEKRTGTYKLPVTGLRPSDSEADGQVAVATLRAMGGDVAIVDDSGNFESSTLQPGPYHVLALSHYQPRNDRAAIEPELKGVLDSYFEKPEQLLGKCRYQLDKLKVSGQKPALRNYLFERE